MTITQILEAALVTALESLDIPHKGTIHLEHPHELAHGDFATNIALSLAKEQGENPRALAERIAEALQEQKIPEIQSIEVAGPGFINFSLSQEFFVSELALILKEGDDYGTSDAWKGKTIVIEHSSPNLFKPFHIGHMMNNTIGESIVRLCKTHGAKVIAMSYPSDVSLGVGKAVWQLMEEGVERLNDPNTSLVEKISFLGECYTKGTQAYDANPDIHERVREITQDIYEKKATDAYACYERARDLNLEYFKDMTKRLGSVFDDYIFESEAGVTGKALVLENTPAIYTESDHAVIYEGEDDGLHTRVFINKEGNPTYEAKDTGLLQLKFDRYHPDLSVFVTDHEQGPYFQVVVSAAGKINPVWKERTVHKTHGRMQFKGEKMSSRLGNTPLVSDILDTVNQEVKLRAGERTLDEKETDAISIAALKYTILRTQAGKNINFDPDTSLSFEGDSGPYLQYTYARCQSLLTKAKEMGMTHDNNPGASWQTLDLEKYLYRYPEVLDLSFNELLPHHVVSYVTELAQIFNSWYGNTKILDEENTDAGYMLALTEATAQIIHNALWVLGIGAPQQM